MPGEFRGREGIRHTVPVEAETLFEAAALALALPARGRGCRPATEIDVAVSELAESRTASELCARRAWLDSSGGTPKEQATKVRLRENAGWRFLMISTTHHSIRKIAVALGVRPSRYLNETLKRLDNLAYLIHAL